MPESAPLGRSPVFTREAGWLFIVIEGVIATDNERGLVFGACAPAEVFRRSSLGLAAQACAFAEHALGD